MLLLAAMGVGILSTLFFYARYFSGTFGMAFSLVQSILFAAIWGVLVIFIWKGQNWARIAALVFVAYSMITVLFSLTRVLSMSGATNFLPSFSISLIAAGVRAYAAFLLFQPEANSYFKSR